MKQHYVIPVVITLLASCDCVVRQPGFVFDSSTGKPIADATISFEKEIFKTNDRGYFHVDYVSGFCPDGPFVIKKPNYKPFELLVNGDADEITYSVKNRLESRDFEKPIKLDSTGNSYITGDWIELNSRNFGVRSDTLIIYLDSNPLPEK